MDNFKELDIYELEQIDGGMSKKILKVLLEQQLILEEQ